MLILEPPSLSSLYASLCCNSFSIPLSARMDVGDPRRDRMRLAVGVAWRPPWCVSSMRARCVVTARPPAQPLGDSMEVVMPDAPFPPKPGGHMFCRSAALFSS